MCRDPGAVGSWLDPLGLHVAQDIDVQKGAERRRESVEPRVGLTVSISPPMSYFSGTKARLSWDFWS